jgi:hypothetical protein
MLQEVLNMDGYQVLATTVEKQVHLDRRSSPSSSR